jgi:hypothetical protein
MTRLIPIPFVPGFELYAEAERDDDSGIWQLTTYRVFRGADDLSEDMPIWLDSMLADGLESIDEVRDGLRTLNNPNHPERGVQL